MEATRYDTVVVGGGIGGMSAGTSLPKQVTKR